MSLKDHKGLGDTVAAVTKQLAIDKLAKAVARVAGKDDCGCDKRQDALNKMFPYKQGKDVPPAK